MRPLGRGFRWRWLPTLALAASFLPAVAAGATGASVAGARPEAASPDDARAWLQRIHAAANTSSYRGTLVFSAGGSMASSRVWHYGVGDQTWEKLESLDGRQRQIIRHNEEVHTLWPQARVAVVERRDALPGWQVTPQSVDPLAMEQYKVRREGISRVAGREADVLLLEPDDQLRYAQRLWADRVTGLMLRAEVLALGPERMVLESASFSEVEIGIKPQPKALVVTAASLQGYRIVRPKQERVNLQDEGWQLVNPVKGFRLKGCVRRELDAGQAAKAGAGSAPVLQAVFTDGLAHASVFIEPFDADRHKREIQVHLGATSTLTLRRDDHWFTAVGDTPASTLRLLAESLSRSGR